jgi:hypothetical protein
MCIFRDDARWVSMVKSRGESPGPVVIKKDDEPHAQFDRGYEPLLNREGGYVYTKEGTRVPSKNTEALVCN